MKVRIALVLVYALGVFGLAAAGLSAADKKAGAKIEIDEVMKNAMKKGALLDKIKQGNASDADVQQFIAYTKALMEAQPPKGDMASWQKKTKALHEAAVAYAKDHKAMDALTAASNCKQCHNAHKPD
jgi:hypothetical protein